MHREDEQRFLTLKTALEPKEKEREKTAPVADGILRKGKRDSEKRRSIVVDVA